jgi:hypothetical protein
MHGFVGVFFLSCLTFFFSFHHSITGLLVIVHRYFFYLLYTRLS